MKNKTLLKTKGIYGLFLWLDYGVPKLVIAYIKDGAKAGDTYEENVDAWECGNYIHYWDYKNETLDVALKALEER